MKRTLIYLLLAFLILFSSCGNWLDVQPFDQVSEEQQYSKAEGYYNQLNGIYRTMAEPALYGKELSWGLLDVLAQYYDMSPNSTCSNRAYRSAAEFNYEYEKVKPLLAAFWEKGYNAIANCNNLIQNVMSADSSLFPLREKERRCIEGEARALRGMLHFDLLRMYAPALDVDADGKYIPYVDFFPTHVAINMESNKILDKVTEDLLQAHRLTMAFDTLYKGNISNLDRRLELLASGNLERFMNYRGYRLNHYAIKALLARVYLYQGNRKEALKWAQEVMGLADKGWFKFTSDDAVKTGRNVKLYGDVLFALYNNNASLYEAQENTGESQLTLWDYETLFGDDENRDIRRYQWEQTAEEEYLSLKYRKADEGKKPGKISNTMIPMIRLSELCYILAECTYQKDKDSAEQFLNYVRLRRGCTTELAASHSQDDFNRLILNDFRRELYGEGQLFFFYKRLGLEAIGDSKTTVKIGEKFVFPQPESNDI